MHDSMITRIWGWCLVLVWGVCLLTPIQAQAFCGFFASSAKADVYNDVTQVALMRHETTTVLSMRNTYKGPPKNFAMVVPVPHVLKKEDIKTIEDDVFDRLDKLTAPRLVEYFEQDPCEYTHQTGTRLITLSETERITPRTTVKVEAKFKVGEYDVKILSAKNSTKLATWLASRGYNVPKGASKALAPYVALGMYFFVAKVDAKRVKFDASGNAMLSPLRFAYDSEDFSLPVRLGLLNSNGKQDLSVFLLSRGGRYEASNYPNTFIPTNLVVKDEVRHDFPTFYDALLDWEFERAPGTIVTEYVWDSPSKCDPCPPTGALDSADLDTLGRDLIQARYISLKRLRWDGRDVSQDYIRSLEPAFVACYNELESPPTRGPLSMKLDLEIDENHSVVSRRVLLDGFDGTKMESCVNHALDRAKIARSHKTAPAYLIARIHFVLDSYNINRNNGWTVTRLRARYSPKTMKDDIQFTRAPVARSDVGAPEGVESYFRRFGPMYSQDWNTNKFQARYVLLNPWTGATTCEHTNRGVWGKKSSSGEYVDVTKSSGKKIDPKALSTYIIGGPKELMSPEGR